jgi:hypothetical protein
MKSKVLSLGVVIVLGSLQGVYALQVPSFVLNPPAGHYAGISEPCSSLSEARRSAVSDVVRQVLSSIGMKHDYRSIHSAQGTTGNPGRYLKDTISSESNGFVSGVEQNMVKGTFSRDENGKYVYFLLVRYSKADISRMRKLTRGANVSASVIKISEGFALIRVSEANGIPVVINCADVHLHKRNRFAKTISYFVMKVPSGSTAHYQVGVGPVTISGTSADVRVPLTSNGMGDYLLGASVSRSVTLSGMDEVGRKVEARLSF